MDITLDALYFFSRFDGDFEFCSEVAVSGFVECFCVNDPDFAKGGGVEVGKLDGCFAFSNARWALQDL